MDYNDKDFDDFKSKMEREQEQERKKQLLELVKSLDFNEVAYLHELTAHGILRYVEHISKKNKLKPSYPAYYAENKSTGKVIGKVSYHFGDFTEERDEAERKANAYADEKIAELAKILGLSPSEIETIKVDPSVIALKLQTKSKDEALEIIGKIEEILTDGGNALIKASGEDQSNVIKEGPVDTGFDLENWTPDKDDIN